MTPLFSTLFITFVLQKKNMNKITINGKTFVPRISKQEIEQKVWQLAKQISNDYADKNPLFLVILNGAFIFAADLFRYISVPSEVSFTRFSSYSGTNTTGEVKQLMNISNEVKGRHVIVVEDIVDTGVSMSEILPQLERLGAKSIELAVLLSKPERREREVNIKYLGFEIPNEFVLGYGLDYDEKGRNLPEIYALETL